MTRKAPLPKAQRMKRRKQLKEKVKGEIHGECVSAVDETEAALLLTQIGTNISRRVRGDYVLVDPIDIEMASPQKCGLPRHTTQEARAHQAAFYAAAEKYRETKRKDYKQRLMAKMAEHWDRGKMGLRNKRCYCGKVVIGRFPFNDCIRRGGFWDYRKGRCIMLKRKR